jgi:hypothetical protein
MWRNPTQIFFRKQSSLELNNAIHKFLGSMGTAAGFAASAGS